MKVDQKIKYQGKEGRVTGFFEDMAYIRLKRARQDEMVAAADLEVIEEIVIDKLSKVEKGELLKKLVEPETLKTKYVEELVLLNMLVKKFPNLSFWRNHFAPALKVDSLTFWLYVQADVVEKEYRAWTIDLTTSREENKLEKDKVVEDVEIKKKPKTLLDILY